MDNVDRWDITALLVHVIHNKSILAAVQINVITFIDFLRSRISHISEFVYDQLTWFVMSSGCIGDEVRPGVKILQFFYTRSSRRLQFRLTTNCR